MNISLDETFIESCIYLIFLIIFGTLLLLVAFTASCIQWRCNCCSGLKNKYSLFDIRTMKAGAIVFSLYLSIFAAIGIYHSIGLYRNLSNPVYPVQGLVYKTEGRVDSIVDFVNETSILYPSEKIPSNITNFQIQLNNFKETMKLLESHTNRYSQIISFCIFCSFVLLACLPTLVFLFVLTWKPKIPKVTIYYMLFLIFIFTIGCSFTGILSKTISDECNISIDNTIYNSIDKSKIDICEKEILYHYLFCNKWPSTNSSCTNELNEMIEYANLLLDAVNWETLNLQHIERRLEQEIMQLKLLEDCSDTRKVYQKIRRYICWNVSNELIHISYLYILLIPQLFIFNLFLLYGWYRYPLRNGSITNTLLIISI
eukprot:TRINITY_DN8498_c0_g1_i3.p1 TRINITY_DN8498_c0_g1~~TRINITY_DN8498_c0_g1_i3.p1  ORF type:complete len:371 (+),score=31.78 TRINITY_DN8498_c0_g1_i3:257-1369(+)